MTSLFIELPADLIASVGEDRLRNLAREVLLARLYDLGIVSAGRTAEILGISRRAMIDLLGAYGVSEFDEETVVGEEADRG